MRSIDHLSGAVIVDLNRGILGEFLVSSGPSYQPDETYSIHPVHIGEAAVATKVARSRVRAVMTKVASKVTALGAGAAHKVPRPVAKGKDFGRVQALPVFKVAVDAVPASIRQVVSVAKIRAALLPAFLKSLNRAWIWLVQPDVNTLIILVELVEGARDGCLFLACNVDGHGNIAPSHCSIAARRRPRFAGGQGSRRRGFGRGRRLGRRAGRVLVARPMVQDRRGCGRRCAWVVRSGRGRGCESRRNTRPGRHGLGAEYRGKRDAPEGKLFKIGSCRSCFQEADLVVIAE